MSGQMSSLWIGLMRGQKNTAQTHMFMHMQAKEADLRCPLRAVTTVSTRAAISLASLGQKGCEPTHYFSNCDTPAVLAVL